jgi:hypothetical protein|tara:strand:- start:251 stop:400 length:150 start_codon:yes stop_codon:yes gene_type:complete
MTKQQILNQLDEIKNRLTNEEKADGTLTLVNNLIEEVNNSPIGLDEEYA